MAIVTSDLFDRTA